jgi:hypothetical protein
MAKKNKNTKTTKKTKGIDLEAYADKANSSARHFVALLGEAIIKLPRIREFTQEAADKKGQVILDSLYKAFIDAQSDAIKCGAAQIADIMGLPPLWALGEEVRETEKS